MLFTLIANSVSGHVFDHYDVLYLQLGLLPLACLLDEASSDPMPWGCFASPGGADRQLAAGPAARLWLEHQGVVSGAGARVLGNSLLWACPCSFWSRSGAPGTCEAPPLARLAGHAGAAGQQRLGRAISGTAGRSILPRSGSIASGRNGPTDKIWVDGIQPQYYLWTDRQPASAYLFFANVNPALTCERAGAGDIQRQSPKSSSPAGAGGTGAQKPSSFPSRLLPVSDQPV